MSLRDLERESIRAFVQDSADAGLIRGAVLDYGCGRQPYRQIVEREILAGNASAYVPYDRMSFPGSTVHTDVGPEHPLDDRWDTILTTQTIQYVRNPARFLLDLKFALKPGGVLLMTGPTNWPLVEKADRQRFTPAGIEALMGDAGFTQVGVKQRAHAVFEGEKWPLGWSAVAKP